MYMKLKDGKSKVLTLSYDDGVVQDIRFIDILNANGLKATFNINTGKYLDEDAERQRYYGTLKLSEAQKLYRESGHEVAVHTLSHPFFNRLQMPDVLREVLEDRKNIETQYYTIARGMAYPYGLYSDEIVDALKACGICYARTILCTEKFDFPKNWLTLHPTCHHNHPKLMEMARRFVEIKSTHLAKNWMFYMYGHTYEFDNDDNWSVIEQFAEYMGNRDDIWYATNIEIYDYVKAYERLQVSVDESIIYNPSVIDVWFAKDNFIYCVRGGETLSLK